MIQSRTKQGLSAIEITCFYEELPIRGVGLVCVPAYELSCLPTMLLTQSPGCASGLCDTSRLYPNRDP